MKDRQANDDANTNKAAQIVIRAMPNLKDFRWKDMPLRSATMRTLQLSSVGVSEIDIEYPGFMCYTSLGYSWSLRRDEAKDRAAQELYELQDISAFRNLESLQLTNIYGELDTWRRHLVEVLTNSPRLRCLGLAIDEAYLDCTYRKDHMQECHRFFDKICDEYAEAGGVPLGLRYLRCGLAVFPTKSGAIWKLVDRSSLEDIYIHNQDVQLEEDLDMYTPENLDLHDGYHRSKIPYRDILCCPNLRRFAAYELEESTLKSIYHSCYHSCASTFPRHFTLSVQDSRDWSLRTANIEFDSYDIGDIDRRPEIDGINAEIVIHHLEHVCGYPFEGSAPRPPRWTPSEEGMDELMRLLTDCLEQRPEITALYVRTGIFRNAELNKATLQLPVGVGSGLQSINVDGITWETSRASCEGGEDTIRLGFRMVRDKPLFWA